MGFPTLCYLPVSEYSTIRYQRAKSLLDNIHRSSCVSKYNRKFCIFKNIAEVYKPKADGTGFIGKKYTEEMS